MTDSAHPSQQNTLCYVSDRSSLPDGAGAIVERIRFAAEAEADWIQIREKDLSTRELLALVQDAAGILKKVSRGARLIVNNRLDIALATGAAGVHLGGQSVGVFEVASWCRRGNAPPGFLIGVSCHCLEEALQAERAGASYVFFGPVCDTPSKRAFGSPLGLDRLGSVCAAVRIPVIAIGGMDEKNAEKSLHAGAAGIAAIRFFQDSTDVASLKPSLERLHRIVRESPAKR
jgi:thiamine-phosphate pyrophosphorylase